MESVVHGIKCGSYSTKLVPYEIKLTTLWMKYFINDALLLAIKAQSVEPMPVIQQIPNFQTWWHLVYPTPFKVKLETSWKYFIKSKCMVIKWSKMHQNIIALGYG